MTDEKLKQFKEKIEDEIKQAKKQKALERAILKFAPKKKRGFLQIGATCIIPTQFDKYYMPFKKVRIKGYEITNAFGLIVICESCYALPLKPKNATLTFKFHIENIYHSVMDYVENFYQTTCWQIQNIQSDFSQNKISGHKKETAEMTLRKLINIKRKIDEKRRRKSKPNIQIPIN